MSNKFTPEFELAQIIRDKYKELAYSNMLSSHQKGVLSTMAKCRTPAMGGQMMVCKQCGHTHYHFHSCRNRNCTLCGGMKRRQWVEKRKADLLPVRYLHMVFTLPHQLNKLCLNNQKLLFPILMKSAWYTINKFGQDHKHLGAKMGAVMVLHTWGQNLAYHPHVHCLVPAGGITKQGAWRNIKSKGKYFAPVKQMSAVFRGKFTDELYCLQETKAITLETPIDIDNKHLHPLYKNKWVVYAKKPMPSGDKVIEYIGRYVHRVAISNSRIKAYDGESVTFSWFNYKNSKSNNTTINALDFLQQFALHILPRGFAKIRHYGILACRNKTELIRNIRVQLNAKPIEATGNQESWLDRFIRLNGQHPHLCKHCKAGIMVIIKELPRIRDGPANAGIKPQKM